jgi:hypothetical protein
MTSKKVLAVSAMATSILMVALAVYVTPQSAYASTTKSGTVTWSICNSSAQGSFSIFLLTPPTTQAKFTHNSDWPVGYSSTISSFTCEAMGFKDHKDKVTDNTQGWTFIGTTTVKSGTITYVGLNGHTINFGDSVIARDVGEYKGSITGNIEAHTANTGNYIAN